MPRHWSYAWGYPVFADLILDARMKLERKDVRTVGYLSALDAPQLMERVWLRD